MSKKLHPLITTTLAACGLLLGSLSVAATAATEPAPTSTTTATKLSAGQTDISMALAKAELSKLGITHPTPAQLDAALQGGVVTTASGSTVELKGILTQRQSGMGWGQIAHAMGLKLGAVVSAAKSAARHDAAEHDMAHATTDETGHAGGNSGKGTNGGHGGNGGGGGGGGNGGGKK